MVSCEVKQKFPSILLKNNFVIFSGLNKRRLNIHIERFRIIKNITTKDNNVEIGGGGFVEEKNKIKSIPVCLMFEE